MMPRNVSLPIYFLFRQLISNSLLILTPQDGSVCIFLDYKTWPVVTSRLQAPIFHWAPSPIIFLPGRPLQISHPSSQTCAGLSGEREARLWWELLLFTRARVDCQGSGWVLQQFPADSRFHSKQRGEMSDFFSVRSLHVGLGEPVAVSPGLSPCPRADGQPEGRAEEGSPGRRAALGSGEGLHEESSLHRRGLQPRGYANPPRGRPLAPLRAHPRRAGRTRASRAALPRSTEAQPGPRRRGPHPVPRG